MRWLFGLCIAGALAAQAPSIEQSMNMKSLGSAVLSPNGKLVAYSVSETNWEDNAYVPQIWLANTESGQRYQVTRSKKGASGAAWSPDSRQLAFVSDRDGKRQIYLIPPEGGEALQLTKHETAVTAIEWSPDGKSIAFTAEEAESKEAKARKEKYGEFQLVQRDYVHTHLWVVKVGEDVAKATQLSKGKDFTVHAFSWSPDSKQIAFSGPKVPDLSALATSDIYVVEVKDASLRKLVSLAGPDTNPQWSPDGKWIAFDSAAGRDDYFYANTPIGIVATAGGTPRFVLSKGTDEDPVLLAWGPGGLYVSTLDKTASRLLRVNPETEATDVVTPAGWAMNDFTFSRDWSKVAFSGGKANEYSELFASAMKPFVPRKLTAMSDQFDAFRSATRELVQWKSQDGAMIEGVLIKPRNFDPAKKYPLLVVIHGGPRALDRPLLAADRYYPIEKFVEKGALVLRPNYRGSTGYGEKFRTLNVRNLGVGDAWDVISGVDALIAKGIVDKDRVGAMGWSQGGYISAFLTCSSDRFKAISVGAGISDWMTYYVNTDIHPFTRQYLKATPWEDPEIYKKTSPISYVKAAKTPTLIQHGELDKRVPIPNAYELYQALQDRGVPVQLSVFKGFGHGIDKPKQQRAVLEQNWLWFSRWIWGESETGEVLPTP